MYKMQRLLIATLFIGTAVSANETHHQHTAHKHATETTNSTEAATPTPTDEKTDNEAASVDSDATCQVSITGNDRMKYNIKEFAIPASCDEFTINFANVGSLPKTSMGHNVVIAKKADAQAVAIDGMSAGVQNDYLPPDDKRVIVKTAMIGGGEKTSLTFPTDSLEKGGEYLFFCSFPGHFFTMQGIITVE